MGYSQERKESVLKKMLPPANISITALAKSDQGKAGQKIQFFARRTMVRKTRVVVFRLGFIRRVYALPDRARSAK